MRQVRRHLGAGVLPPALPYEGDGQIRLQLADCEMNSDTGCTARFEKKRNRLAHRDAYCTERGNDMTEPNTPRRFLYGNTAVTRHLFTNW